jgi:septal ring factor EnvC (AmiA/AmiB activator)
MAAWLKLVPSWAWASAAGLVLTLVVGGVQQVRVYGLQVSLANEQSAHSSYRTEVAERDRRAAMFVIQENQRRQAATEKADAEAQQQLAAARGDAERAGSALERLKLRLAAAEQRSRDAGNSITAQLGQAAEDAARMRADMLGRLGEAVRFYAAVADERGVAGATCEKAYEGLRGE